MRIDQVNSQLLDVPPVFKPTGATYQAVISAVLAGLEDLGATTEALAKQLDLLTASASWLDLWGLLVQLPRTTNEGDTQYRARIQATLLGGTATVAGIGAFLSEAFGLSVIIQENFTTNSWMVTFSVPLTDSQLTTIALALARIRPAGIPFFPFNVVAGGMYLYTTMFLGMTYAQGAYLEAPTQQFYPNIGPNTNSLLVVLPLSYMNIPTTFPT